LADFTARASHPDLAKREEGQHLGVVMGWEKRRGMREARRPFLDGGTIMDLEADSDLRGKLEMREKEIEFRNFILVSSR
jgi:hypothetical protein